ncbi:MAG: hypothetical protein JSW62_04175 [Thermoplasmatales archaeon]|nr:MAG: hypothetical protein JSW62_04175 [Thermoplasmatales archaeon]
MKSTIINIGTIGILLIFCLIPIVNGMYTNVDNNIPEGKNFKLFHGKAEFSDGRTPIFFFADLYTSFIPISYGYGLFGHWFLPIFTTKGGSITIQLSSPFNSYITESGSRVFPATSITIDVDENIIQEVPGLVIPVISDG